MWQPLGDAGEAVMACGGDNERPIELFGNGLGNRRFGGTASIVNEDHRLVVDQRLDAFDDPLPPDPSRRSIDQDHIKRLLWLPTIPRRRPFQGSDDDRIGRLRIELSQLLNEVGQPPTRGW